VKERTAPITSAQYLGAQIKAAMGDDQARRTVLAADDSTSTNTGLTLPAHLNMFDTTTFSGRPAFDAVTRAGVVPQLSFTIPKMGTAPTTAVTAEGAAPSETGMTSTYDTITASKYSTLNRVSFELLDFSNPAFETLLLDEMRKGYEKATDNALIAYFTSAGTQATGVAATAAGLQSFISTQGPAAYKATGGDYANKLVASTDQWAAILGYADTTGRALFNAESPMNASGNGSINSTVGRVLGADLVVDHNISVSGIVDESAFLVAPNSVYVWESPVTNLRLNGLTSGEIEINMYGYLAIHAKAAGAGIRRFNLS
jgi:HK97 family phage major capsid protein